MKKALLSLFVGFICSISFGYCTDIVSRVTSSVNSSNTYNGSCSGYCCIQSSASSKQLIRLNYGGVEYQPFAGSYNNNDLYCFELLGSYTLTNANSTAINVYNYDIPISSGSGDCPSCPTCPDSPSCPRLPTTLNVFGVNLSLSGYDYVSLHGDGISYNGSSSSEYSGINYYTVSLNNDYTGNICTGDSIGTGINWSALFINGIEHQSAPLINVTIPEEYSWDSTVDESEFDLVISGSNVDYEYIDNIITTQKTLPNGQDFNNIVSGLIPLFVPGLCIILLIYFIYLFIKKIF